MVSYANVNAFKLNMFDVGLLGAASRLDVSTLPSDNALFEKFKGALAKQYVRQQPMASDKVVHGYWTYNSSTSEVDLIYDYGGEVYPVEVKAETNLCAKSLRFYSEKYHIEKLLRLSLSGSRDQGCVRNVPLYAAGMLPGCLKDKANSRDERTR